MSKHFPICHIRNMHFYHRCTYCSDAVADGHAGMCVTSCVENDSIALRFLLRGEWEHVASVWNAHMAVYRRLPELLKQRQEIQRTRKDYNRNGLYRGSIIIDRYFRGIKSFSQLNQRLFIKNDRAANS